MFALSTRKVGKTQIRISLSRGHILPNRIDRHVTGANVTVVLPHQVGRQFVLSLYLSFITLTMQAKAL